MTYVGNTFAVPTYSKSGALVAVFAGDISGPTVLQRVISNYAEFCDQAYAVESSTYNLVMTTTGESSYDYSKSAIKKASDSVNDLTSASASYLTNTNTLWRADGDYALTVGGVAYNVNLKTFTDATATLSWRIVVIGERQDDYVADYKPTIQEAMEATKNAIKNMWDYAQSIPKSHVFLHGASDISPYAPSSPLPMSFDAPALQSRTQQAFWGAYKAAYQTANLPMFVSFQNE